MEMSGEYRIPAPRPKVWEMLNDPEVLKQCIPGCQSLEPTEDGGFNATVKMKVGPVSATFKGSVSLKNVQAPESYTIVGEGKGGVAGFGKGGADVSLAVDGDGTSLTYNANVQVGGKLAQLGSRLIDSTARKMADDFFGKFAALVSEAAASDAPAATPEAASEAPAAAAPATAEVKPSEPAPAKAPKPAAASNNQGNVGGLSKNVWIIIGVAAVLVLVLATNLG